MRLIDADELREQCDDPFWCVWLGDIDNAPTIDAVPVVHGMWDCNAGLPTCTACGKMPREFYIDGSEKWPFCPNCGAKMDGGKDDESHPFADDVMMGERKDDE